MSIAYLIAAVVYGVVLGSLCGATMWLDGYWSRPATIGCSSGLAGIGFLMFYSAYYVWGTNA